MRLTVTLFATVLFFTEVYGQQVQSQSHFMRRAMVEHHAGSATVVANDPRPLFQAITAVREEYGWVVDYEEPPYFSKYDLVDTTDPAWRAAGGQGRFVRGRQRECSLLMAADTAGHLAGLHCHKALHALDSHVLFIQRHKKETAQSG